MTYPLTREQVQAAATSASAERDTIQANILELDGSFGKRLLAGAALTGQSRDSWEKASATLARLWDTFTAYSAVIDRASAIPGGPLDLEDLKIIVLMVFWSLGEEPDALILDELFVDVEDRLIH